MAIEITLPDDHPWVIDRRSKASRIAELEAALYAALHGHEVVTRGEAAGEIERKTLADGGILWRRKYVAG